MDYQWRASQDLVTGDPKLRRANEILQVVLQNPSRPSSAFSSLNKTLTYLQVACKVNRVLRIGTIVAPTSRMSNSLWGGIGIRGVKYVMDWLTLYLRDGV